MNRTHDVFAHGTVPPRTTPVKNNAGFHNLVNGKLPPHSLPNNSNTNLQHIPLVQRKAVESVRKYWDSMKTASKREEEVALEQIYNTIKDICSNGWDKALTTLDKEGKIPKDEEFLKGCCFITTQTGHGGTLKVLLSQKTKKPIVDDLIIGLAENPTTLKILLEYSKIPLDFGKILMAAVVSGVTYKRTDVVKAILEHPSIEIQHMHTPLQKAYEMNGGEQIVRVFLENPKLNPEKLKTYLEWQKYMEGK